MRQLVLLALLGALAAAPATAQSWRGAYDCPLAQGPTAMTLKIERRDGDAVVAQLTFFAQPDNPGDPTGCYRLSGEMTKGGDVNLQPLGWILRPPIYVMTGLIGSWNEGDGVVAGVIDNPACAGFELKPVAPTEPVPSCELAISRRTPTPGLDADPLPG